MEHRGIIIHVETFSGDTRWTVSVWCEEGWGFVGDRTGLEHLARAASLAPERVIGRACIVDRTSCRIVRLVEAAGADPS